MPGIDGGSRVSAVVRFGDRFLAFGWFAGGCCDGGFSADTQAVIWTSPDGLDWTRAPTGPEMALGVMHDATATPDQIVVVGDLRLESTFLPGGAPAPAVWTSEDGDQWVLARNVPPLTRVEATADGFLGVSNVRAFPELWWSRTGLHWELLAGKEAFGSGRINQLLSTPAGLLAVGTTVNHEALASARAVPDGDAAVWLAADARRWTAVPTNDALASAEIHDVAWVEGQLLAIGTDAIGQPVVWISEDARTWALVPGPPADSGRITQLTMVSGLPDRFAVTGTVVAQPRGASGLRLWTTLDGLGWQRINPSPGRPGEQAVAAVVLEDGGAAILGGSWDEEAKRGVPGAWLLEPAR